MYVANVHVYFYFYHGICVPYEMLKKSRSTNNEMRYIGDLYMFFMSSVSTGQCVNQTSGYWFIVFIVIWHICIVYLYIVDSSINVLIAAAAEFLKRYEVVDFFYVHCIGHITCTVMQKWWIMLTGRLQYWLHDWYSAGILWIAWNNCSVIFL